ncbi:MAG: hypothetical protein GF317_25035 [Candidatus Lokiarchaeota archaeon]|nr:hypothetical protein [Candidatus Lokiarchaeota archaeon]
MRETKLIEYNNSSINKKILDTIIDIMDIPFDEQSFEVMINDKIVSENHYIYDLDEILFCLTWKAYRRSNNSSWESLKDYIMPARREFYHQSLTSVFSDAFEKSFESEVKSNAVIIYKSVIDKKKFKGPHEFVALRTNLDLIADNYFCIRPKQSLTSLRYGRIYLDKFDKKTNYKKIEVGKKVMELPKYKPIKVDINKLGFNLILRNYVRYLGTHAYLIYFPLQTSYRYDEHEYDTDIFIFKIIFPFNTNIIRRTINERLSLYHYLNYQGKRDIKYIPAYASEDKFINTALTPSRLCHLGVTKYMGCNLKKRNKENGITYDYECGIDKKGYKYSTTKKEEEEGYTAVRSLTFPLLIPFFTKEELKEIKNAILKITKDFITEKLQEVSSKEINEINKTINTQLGLILNDLFLYKYNKLHTNRTNYNTSRIVREISDAIKEGINERYKIDIWELGNILNNYVEENISPKIFKVEQDEQIRWDIMKIINMYITDKDKEFYNYISHRFIGECPRYTKLTRDNFLRNKLKEFYQGKRPIRLPSVLRNELRINFLNHSIQQYLADIMAAAEHYKNYKGYEFKYYKVDTNITPIGSLKGKVPILFFFSPSLFNLDKELDRVNKKNPYREGTGKFRTTKRGKIKRTPPLEEELSPKIKSSGERLYKQILIPREKDIYQTIILQSLLKDKAPMLMIYIPRNIYNDIRIFKVKSKKSLEEIDTFIDKSKKRMSKGDPYTYREFLDNEIRCMYCPYSWLISSKTREPICREGIENRKRFIKELEIIKEKKEKK